jgi:ssDNA-binding Zn-finger/Zn-ribbon topoisomerase 1
MSGLNWDRVAADARGQRHGNEHLKSRPFSAPKKKKQKNTPPSKPAPKCPKCKSHMVRRTGKFGPFWGCKQYPRCQGTSK